MFDSKDRYLVFSSRSSAIVSLIFFAISKGKENDY